MLDDRVAFKAKEPTDTTVTIRMNKTQKTIISRLVEERGLTMSRFILDLVDAELQRMQNALGSGDKKVKINDYKKRKVIH